MKEFSQHKVPLIVGERLIHYLLRVIEFTYPPIFYTFYGECVNIVRIIDDCVNHSKLHGSPLYGEDYFTQKNWNMKKLILILVTSALVSTTMISCSKKCGHCETNGSAGDELCSSDNHAVYDAAVTSCALGGGTWVND